MTMRDRYPPIEPYDTGSLDVGDRNRIAWEVSVAADTWCEWEDAMAPGESLRFRDDPPSDRMTFARLVTHDGSHGSWLEDDQLLRDAGRLRGIPGVLIEGAMDLGDIAGTPWLLHAAWPGSELVMVDDAGHDTSDPMADAIGEATDRFRTDGTGRR